MNRLRDWTFISTGFPILSMYEVTGFSLHDWLFSYFGGKKGPASKLVLCVN